MYCIRQRPDYLPPPTPHHYIKWIFVSKLKSMKYNTQFCDTLLSRNWFWIRMVQKNGEIFSHTVETTSI